MTNYSADIEDFTPAGQERARLARNAQPYRYDKLLDDAANLYETDPQAWSRLPVLLQDRSGLYLDQRSDYRAAVRAGAIPDRTPDPTKEN